MRNVISIVAILLIATAMAGLLVYYSLYEASFEALSDAESSLVISEAMSGNKAYISMTKARAATGWSFTIPRTRR